METDMDIRQFRLWHARRAETIRKRRPLSDFWEKEAKESERLAKGSTIIISYTPAQ